MRFKRTPRDPITEQDWRWRADHGMAQPPIKFPTDRPSQAAIRATMRLIGVRRFSSGADAARQTASTWTAALVPKGESPQAIAPSNSRRSALRARNVLSRAARNPGKLQGVVIGPEVKEMILGSSVSMWLWIAVTSMPFARSVRTTSLTPNDERIVARIAAFAAGRSVGN